MFLFLWYFHVVVCVQSLYGWLCSYSKVTEMHSVHTVGLNDVKISLKLTNEIDPSSPICMQLYNIIFKRYSKLCLQIPHNHITWVLNLCNIIITNIFNTRDYAEMQIGGAVKKQSTPRVTWGKKPSYCLYNVNLEHYLGLMINQ